MTSLEDWLRGEVREKLGMTGANNIEQDGSIGKLKAEQKAKSRHATGNGRKFADREEAAERKQKKLDNERKEMVRRLLQSDNDVGRMAGFKAEVGAQLGRRAARTYTCSAEARAVYSRGTVNAAMRMFKGKGVPLEHEWSERYTADERRRTAMQAVCSSNTDTECEAWDGDAMSMGSVPLVGHTRICFQNLRRMKDDVEEATRLEEDMFQIMAAMGLDVAALSDHGLWGGVGKAGMYDQTSKSGKAARRARECWGGDSMLWSVAAGVQSTKTATKRLGGTMVAVHDRLSHRAQVMQADALGRWAGVRVLGEGGRGLVIVSIYRPSRSSDMGSMWEQQKKMLQTKEKARRGDASELFYEDLTRWVMSNRRKGDMLMIGGDWNEEWAGKRVGLQTAMRDLAGSLGLVNLMQERHGRLFPTWYKSWDGVVKTSIDHVLVSKELVGEGVVRSIGVWKGRQLNGSDHRPIVIEMDIHRLLGISQGGLHKREAREKPPPRLGPEDEELIPHYQKTAVELWRLLRMERRLAELEKQAAEKRWEEQDEMMQRGMDELMWLLTRIMLVAERMTKGQGAMHSSDRKSKKKGGWSVDYIKIKEQMEAAKRVLRALPLVSKATAQDLGIEYERRFLTSKVSAVGLRTPRGRCSERKWEEWVMRLKGHCREVQKAITSKHRWRMRNNCSARNRRIEEHIRAQKWGRVVNTIMKVTRESGDRSSLQIDGVVISDRKEVGEALKKFFYIWMGGLEMKADGSRKSYLKKWQEDCPLFWRAAEGRRMRQGVVDNTLTDEEREQLEDTVPAELREVIWWHERKYVEKLGRRIDQEDYKARGVMKDFTKGYWRTCAMAVGGNKAADYHGKHWSLVKMLGKECDQNEDGGGRQRVCSSHEVFDGIRRMLNLVARSGMVYTDWTVEVLVTLLKVQGSKDINDTRPIGLVDVLRNQFMGMHMALIVGVWAEHEVIAHPQYGFMPNKGTDQARLVQVLVMEISMILQRGMAHGTDDARRAFDSPSQMMYEMGMMRLAVPTEFLDLSSIMDQLSMLLIRILNGFSDATTRLCGTVQGGGESPGKWNAWDDPLITKMLERARQLGMELPVSETEGVTVVLTAFADDKHYLTEVSRLEEVYGLQSLYRRFHGLKGVPKKSPTQAAIYTGEGINRKVCPDPEAQMGFKVMITVEDEEASGAAGELKWTKEQLPVVPPDEPIRSLGDGPNTMLSWGWNMQEVAELCKRAELCVKGGLPKAALYRTLKMTVERSIVYKLLMASVSEEELYEVTKPLYKSFKFATGLPQSTSTSAIQAFGGMDLWAMLNIERLVTMYRVLIGKHTVEQKLLKASIHQLQMWYGWERPVLEMDDFSRRGWNHSLVGRVHSFMAEYNIKMVGGEGMKMRRRGDEAIVDAAKRMGATTEEQEVIMWGCFAMDVWRMSELLQGDGQTMRTELEVEGRWEQELGDRKSELSEVKSRKRSRLWAERWRELMQKTLRWWMSCGSRLGGWHREAYTKGALVMMADGPHRGAVGALESWTQGKQWDEGVQVTWMTCEEDGDTAALSAPLEVEMQQIQILSGYAKDHSDEGDDETDQYVVTEQDEWMQEVCEVGVSVMREEPEKESTEAKWIHDFIGIDTVVVTGKLRHRGLDNRQIWQNIMAQAEAAESRGEKFCLKCTSDGSKVNEGCAKQGTGAWAITNPFETNRELRRWEAVTGGTVVHGDPKLIHSTRCEAVAVLSVLMFLVVHGWRWEVEVQLDNSAVVTVANRREKWMVNLAAEEGLEDDDAGGGPVDRQGGADRVDRMAGMRVQDWLSSSDPDVWQEIQHWKGQLQVRLEWHSGHVERREKDRNKWTDDECRNVLADEAAEEVYGKVAIDENFEYPHKPAWHLEWRGQKLVGRVRQRLKLAVKVERFCQFLTNKLARSMLQEEAARAGRVLREKKADTDRARAVTRGEVEGWAQTHVLEAALDRPRDFLKMTGRLKMLTDLLGTMGRLDVVKGLEVQKRECRLCKEEGSVESTQHVLWHCKEAGVVELRWAMLEKIRQAISAAGVEDANIVLLMAVWCVKKEGGFKVWQAIDELEELVETTEQAKKVESSLQKLRIGSRLEAVRWARLGLLGSDWVQLAVSVGIEEPAAKQLSADLARLMLSEEGLQQMLDWHKGHTAAWDDAVLDERRVGRQQMLDQLREVLSHIEDGGLAGRGYGRFMEWTRTPNKQKRWLEVYNRARAAGTAVSVALDLAYKEVAPREQRQSRIGREAGQATILQYVSWVETAGGATGEEDRGSLAEEDGLVQTGGRRPRKIATDSEEEEENEEAEVSVLEEACGKMHVSRRDEEEDEGHHGEASGGAVSCDRELGAGKERGVQTAAERQRQHTRSKQQLQEWGWEGGCDLRKQVVTRSVRRSREGRRHGRNAVGEGADSGTRKNAKVSDKNGRCHTGECGETNRQLYIEGCTELNGCQGEGHQDCRGGLGMDSYSAEEGEAFGGGEGGSEWVQCGQACLEGGGDGQDGDGQGSSGGLHEPGARPGVESCDGAGTCEKSGGEQAGNGHMGEGRGGGSGRGGDNDEGSAGGHEAVDKVDMQWLRGGGATAAHLEVPGVGARLHGITAENSSSRGVGNRGGGKVENQRGTEVAGAGGERDSDRGGSVGDGGGRSGRKFAGGGRIDSTRGEASQEGYRVAGGEQGRGGEIGEEAGRKIASPARGGKNATGGSGRGAGSECGEWGQGQQASQRRLEGGGRSTEIAQVGTRGEETDLGARGGAGAYGETNEDRGIKGYGVPGSVCWHTIAGAGGEKSRVGLHTVRPGGADMVADGGGDGSQQCLEPGGGWHTDTVERGTKDSKGATGAARGGKHRSGSGIHLGFDGMYDFLSDGCDANRIVQGVEGKAQGRARSDDRQRQGSGAGRQVHAGSAQIHQLGCEEIWGRVEHRKSSWHSEAAAVHANRRNGSTGAAIQTAQSKLVCVAALILQIVRCMDIDPDMGTEWQYRDWKVRSRLWHGKGSGGRFQSFLGHWTGIIQTVQGTGQRRDENDGARGPTRGNDTVPMADLSGWETEAEGEWQMRTACSWIRNCEVHKDCKRVVDKWRVVVRLVTVYRDLGVG